ncbi:MAG: hypothetical protein IKE21_07210 [Erysipelotrichaceae bacterium]|nr:hypothetical protein [Erysipelotrichaceae bacterium]
MADRFWMYKGEERYFFPEDYTVLDLETTGLSAERSEIIEIGALRVRNGQPVAEYSRLVKDKYGLPPYIQELTGIREEMLEGEEGIETVLPDFLDWLGEDLIVGQNVSFDLSFLYENVSRYTERDLSADYVDTLTLSRVLLPEMAHHKLSDLCERYGIRNDQAHRSLSDARATYEVLEAMHREAAEIDPEKLALACSRSNALNVYKGPRARTNQFDRRNPLYGKRTVFTGTLSRFRRKDAEQAAIDCGAIVVRTLNVSVDYLIYGQCDSGDLKIKKAAVLQEEGAALKLIPEEEFYRWIDPDNDEKE